MEESERIKMLRPKLPRGYGKRLAEKHNVTKSYVWMVAAGARHNDDIMSDLVDLAQMNTKKKSRNAKKLNTVLNQTT